MVFTMSPPKQNGNVVKHQFSVDEIYIVLKDLEDRVLKRKFQDGWIPLANNVELMGEGEEQDGFGMAIMRQQPGNTTHAQGASYLGPIIEQIGLLEWNGRSNGICWRFARGVPELDELVEMIVLNLVRQE